MFHYEDKTCQLTAGKRTINWLTVPNANLRNAACSEVKNCIECALDQKLKDYRSRQYIYIYIYLLHLMLLNPKMKNMFDKREFKIYIRTWSNLGMKMARGRSANPGTSESSISGKSSAIYSITRSIVKSYPPLPSTNHHSNQAEITLLFNARRAHCMLANVKTMACSS